jgi:hypothetical protein
MASAKKSAVMVTLDRMSKFSKEQPWKDSHALSKALIVAGEEQAERTLEHAESVWRDAQKLVKERKISAMVFMHFGGVSVTIDGLKEQLARLRKEKKAGLRLAAKLENAKEVADEDSAAYFSFLLTYGWMMSINAAVLSATLDAMKEVKAALERENPEAQKARPKSQRT